MADPLAPLPTDPLYVVRYALWNPTTRSWSGDYIKVGNVDLGEFRDLVDWEFQRAKREHPDNPGFHMRSMWYTGSPYGAEILAIAKEARGCLTPSPRS